jgi:hypothetical protein
MKILKTIFLSLSISLLTIQTYGQDNNSTPERTPEQEAVKQTEKLQNELRLSTQQAKQVHEINLKYARERQNSNSRSEALQRLKKKYDDLKQVLSIDQYSRLQNKQYERSSFQSPESNRAVAPTIRSGNNQQTIESSRQQIKTNTREAQTTTNDRPVRREDAGNSDQNSNRSSQSVKSTISIPNTSSGLRNQPYNSERRTEAPRNENRENPNTTRSSEPNRSSGSSRR